jgi:hypothetical protein
MKPGGGYLPFSLQKVQNRTKRSFLFFDAFLMVRMCLNILGFRMAFILREDLYGPTDRSQQP